MNWYDTVRAVREDRRRRYEREAAIRRLIAERRAALADRPRQR